MSDRLKGKVAIVTGASSGMGKASALQFAKEGARVVLVSRTQDKLDAVAKEITDAGGEAIVVAGDVAKEDVNKTMVDTAVDTFGKLDVVFLNAGSLAQFKIVDATEELIDHELGLNVKSVVFGLKYALPAIAKSTNKGSIIVNTSCMGETARANFAGASLYAASKAAGNMLVKYAAIEAAEEGTRVNAIAPGVVATNLMGIPAEYTNEFAKDKQLVGRAGSSEEISNFVTFLASDESSLITGSVQLIDGGWTLKA